MQIAEYQIDMFRKETPWLVNYGKGMPVKKGALVEVLYRSGDICKSNDYDRDLYWEHHNHDADIVYYRILQNGNV